MESQSEVMSPAAVAYLATVEISILVRHTFKTSEIDIDANAKILNTIAKALRMPAPMALSMLHEERPMTFDMAVLFLAAMDKKVSFSIS